MSKQSRFLVASTASLIVLAILVRQTVVQPTPFEMAQFLPAVFFSLLMLFATIFGVAMRSGMASLLPMITIAAYLVLGIVPVGWMAFGVAILHGFIRLFFADRLGMPHPRTHLDLLSVTVANASMHTASILVSGAIFQAIGGTVPLFAVSSDLLVPLIILGVCYFTVNNVIASIYLRMQSQARFQTQFTELPRLLLFEAMPMVIAPLIALIYTQLGGVQFTVFALVLVLLSLITHNLDQTRQRLERRVQELDSLQSVGQALSASLELDTIMSTVYAQTMKLMPAGLFYIALYDAESEGISFPMVMLEGQRMKWPSRPFGNGLTEHVIRTRKPLLLKKNLAAIIGELDIEPVIFNEERALAACWLGVPMIAGDVLLGVVAVQSSSTPDVYDEMHRDILSTIASQAAIAIQNAHLYASTDSALSQRIQELDLILRTTHEGILLLDQEWRILSTNRAFVEFAGLPEVEMKGRVATVWPDASNPLTSTIGYSPAEIKEECRALIEGERWCRRQIAMSGPPERQVERTLVPVRGREAAIEGWLLLLRDITEEVKLSRLRDDMTHMLVHDLRSPLSVIMGSLETSRAKLNDGRINEVEQTLRLAETSGERMLRLINDLLDVYRFENGEIPLFPEPVPVRLLLAEARSQFAPLLADADIEIRLEMENQLPPLRIDLDYVSRALQNLLDNAIKYTEDGGLIRMWARMEKGISPPAILIGVDDLGPGVPPEAQGELFEKFTHGLSPSGRRQGTGLGLPYCRLVCEAHGGEIWMNSSGIPGEGSTFVMRLPVEVNGSGS